VTQTSPIGRRVRGQRNELNLQATEAALDSRNTAPERIPASRLLNDIARDALAAVLRDDSEAIANLPTAVTFRAFVVQSRRHMGCWRLVITTKAYGAWGHCISALITSREWIAALAEMINGPAAVPTAALVAAPEHALLATTNLTNAAEALFGPTLHVGHRSARRIGRTGCRALCAASSTRISAERSG